MTTDENIIFFCLISFRFIRKLQKKKQIFIIILKNNKES